MAENLKSNAITNYDATPSVQATAGEGAPGAMQAQSDDLATTTAAAQFSTYRMARFPTTAKVKHVWGFLSGIEAAATTGGATLDFNVAFSDDTNDGTPAGLVGTIPSNKLDGTSFAFVTGSGYSTAYTNTGTGNAMFGSSIAQTSSAAQLLELTFKNSFKPASREDDLWDVFGFVSQQGVAQDPGGFFDIFVVHTHSITTVAAGTIGIEVDYVV